MTTRTCKLQSVEAQLVAALVKHLVGGSLAAGQAAAEALAALTVSVPAKRAAVSCLWLVLGPAGILMLMLKSTRVLILMLILFKSYDPLASGLSHCLSGLLLLDSAL